MSAARSYTRPSQRVGVLRRVVRREGVYVCGLCRNEYPGERDALSCLSRCWDEVLALEPVVPVRRVARTTFKCRFCARVYGSRGEATECAGECRTRNKKLHEQWLRLVECDGELPPPPKRSLRRATLALVPLKTPKKAPKREAPQESGGAPVNADVKEAASAPAPEPVLAAAPEVAPKKPKPAKPFFRQGAEYVCTICSKHYFTKVEVQKCYDDHPDGTPPA